MQMNQFWTNILQSATALSQSVGQQLLQDFGQVQADVKQDGSLVTQADRWADQALSNSLATAFPDHGVLSEEQAHILPNTDWCWVIDPIDGTTNFARGIPLWAISLGLLYRGTPVFGAVYLPTLNQQFYGFWNAPDQENGAFLNHQSIHARLDAPGSNQFFSFCARSIPAFEHPFPCKVRMLGVASYNLLTVAAGITIGAVEATPKIWDIAGVWPILQAAGATWIALDGVNRFPLETMQDYSQQSFPCLVVSQAQWAECFLPYLQKLRLGVPTP